MLPFEDRYTRQRQVREVGIAGQERLMRLTAVVMPGPSGDVEALYLERAGVGVRRSAFDEPQVFTHERHFAHDTTRDFAASAHRALQTVRRGLGLAEGTK